MIATVRIRGRELLQNVDGAANAVLAEIEAVQDDARDVAENYTDRSASSVTTWRWVLQFRQNTALSRLIDRLREIGWEVRRAHGCLFQLDRPDISGYAPGVDPPLPVRPRRANRP